MQFERLGPYRIGKRIGKGGMGAVYEAVYDQPGPQQGMRVAIKALSPPMAVGEGFRERFEAEILSLMQLSHEGIVQIYGKGEQDGVLFYSMELVEGTSLEEEITSKRRFNWRETLMIGIQVCRALKHAHDVGVVHRDIKPANLLLTPDGRVKIADFGIARFFHNTQLTTAGGVLGTADYMSPEQADGRQVTEKCDQYGLGGVMYALLAGRPPFQAKTMPEMLQLQRFAEPEPVRRYAPETPDQLNRLITQLLAKDPQDRFPNVMVLRRHMEAMEKALSRPLESQAASGETKVEESGADSAANHSTAEVRDEATHALEEMPDQVRDTKDAPVPTDVYDAATLDQPAEAESLEPGSSVLAHEPLRSTFTTVDEEKRRQLDHAGSNLWVVSAQWASLITLLLLLVWGGWRLTRPATADELFEEISTLIEERGDEDLRIVESQLEEFAERFGDDPRNGELDPLRQKLEFQRFERQARLKARTSYADGADPVAVLYLEATRRAQDDPRNALGMLQDLVTVYDPLGLTRDLKPADADTVDDSLEELDQRWLVLARQKINELQQELDEQAKNQLPMLKARSETAIGFEHDRPEQALQMHQAIIRLYGSHPWAGEIVDESRARAAHLESRLAE